MPLSKGDRLGPYEILALVGQGGMGEVYRAHDDRVRRDVAIKVSNAQWTERFTQEARSIAALNHTNTCQLYDVGPNYLVMEYVEGEDLKGPLDFNEALPIIQQLIDGIEAAHEKNIVHRDLKPANIKITPEGVVKILDFGLAKATDPHPAGSSHPEDSTTLTIAATAAGTILGTAAYMAPEQARGKQADKRSDIWSFGVILFELLTGKKLFPGETKAEILGGVLNKDPDIGVAPLRAQRLLRWCLEKDRKQRLASISDARRLLTESGPESPAQASLPHTNTKLWIGAVAVLAAALAAVSWALWRATRPVDRPLVRMNLDLPGYAGGDRNLALSADGTRVAYVTRGADGKNRLATRLLAENEAKTLAGTEGAGGPFFSPNGQWIAFGANGQLKKVSALGGTPLKLTDAPLLLGGSWGEDGFIVASVNALGNLMRIPEAGGMAETLLPPRSQTPFAPQVLLGGRKVIYGQGAAVKILSLGTEDTKDTKKASTLIPGTTYAQYLPTNGASGHLVYRNGSTLMAAPFDPLAGELRGPAVPVLDDVADAVGFSSTGDVLYKMGAASGSGGWPLRWLRPDGKTEPLLETERNYAYPRVSPDGKLLAVTAGATISRTPAENHLLVYDWRNDRTLALTEMGQAGLGAVWTPDSRYVIWPAPAINGSKRRFLWKRADGSGEVHTLVERATYLQPGAISPDGKYLALVATDPTTKLDLWVAPLDLSVPEEMKLGEAEPLVVQPGIQTGAAISPDGKWVAYFSDESGDYAVYVQRFPRGGGHRKISEGGGVWPKWSADGRQLLYLEQNGGIMAVDYQGSGDAFVAGKPRVWSATPIRSIAPDDPWDLDPKGDRVVAIPVTDATRNAGPPKVAYLLHFFDEVRRKAPAGR
jgi:serine/threonine-protein kinase